MKISFKKDNLKRDASAKRNVVKKSIAAFGSDSEDGEEENREEKEVPTPIQSTRNSSYVSRPKTSIDNTGEEQVDPSVYAYDEVYDSMKNQEKEHKEVEENTAGSSKSLHMASIQRAINIRKIDKEEAKKLRNQHARKLEGDLYKDKEVFVTSSYKKHLRDLNEIKDMEAKKEASEARLPQISMQLKIFENTESKHDTIVESSKSNVTSKSHGSKIMGEFQTGESENMEQEQSGRAEVKFELKAGLNIIKPRMEHTSISGDDKSRAKNFIKKQNEHSIKSPTANIGIVENEPAKISTKRNTDERKIQNARERYLARKRMKVS